MPNHRNLLTWQEYSQDKAKKWLGEYINGLNDTTTKMMLSREYAYKRAYNFKVSDPVSRLWERFMKYARAHTKNDNLSVSTEMKKSIRTDFAKHLNALTPIIEKYDAFFHKLVYYMRYKEHVSSPDKIGRPETMRK